MRNLVAKHMRTFNKASVIPDKREKIQKGLDKGEMDNQDNAIFTDQEGEQMNDFNTTEVLDERRKYKAMRERVQEFIDLGWSISGREPLRIEAAGKAYIVKGGLLLDG